MAQLPEPRNGASLRCVSNIFPLNPQLRPRCRNHCSLLRGIGPTWGRLLAFLGKVKWLLPTDWEIAVLHTNQNPLTNRRDRDRWFAVASHLVYL